MVQILDVHVPRKGASAPTVLEQVLVPPLPEARAVGNVAHVRAPLTALPSLVVPPMGLCDPTDIALKFEEEEEEEVEMFDGSHRPLRTLCLPPRKDWSCTFPHAKQEVHPRSLLRADRARASAAETWLSSKKNNLWIHDCPGLWEIRGRCADQTTGVCPWSLACSQEELLRSPS